MELKKTRFTVDHMKTPIFIFLVFTVHILYIGVFLGVLYIDEKYIRYLSTMIQTFVAIFLCVRFQPFNHEYIITDFDKQIIFYLATFLLLNVVITEIYSSFIRNETTDKIIYSFRDVVSNIKK